MSETTKIEWCDASLSPWWGCTKVSPGCANCYAEAVDYRFAPVHDPDRGFKPTHWGKGAPRKRIEGFENEALRLNRKAERLGKRLRVFPSMCDPFDPEVPIEWFVRFFDVMRRTPWLDWMPLTKRPGLWGRRLTQAIWAAIEQANQAAELEGVATREQAALANWIAAWRDGNPPPNVWVGTSVEDQKRADERIPELLKIPAKVRFLSVEPLLGPVDIIRHCNHEAGPHARFRPVACVDWVIVGGESGPQARPMHGKWVRSLRDQCRAASVSFFFKQWGEWFPSDQWYGGDSHRYDRATDSYLIGKKRAGRLLDDREWNDLPKGGAA